MGWEDDPLVFWSGLSWLSGSLTTFHWLSKRLPVGFAGSQFDVENLYVQKTKKYDPFRIFKKYFKIPKIKKNTTLNFSKIQYIRKIRNTKSNKINTNTNTPKKQKYTHNTKIRPVKKQIQKIRPRKNIQKIRPANINAKNTTKFPETGCETKLCDLSVLLTHRQGCLLILRPDCLLFCHNVKKKTNSRKCPDDTSKGHRD